MGRPSGLVPRALARYGIALEGMQRGAERRQAGPAGPVRIAFQSRAVDGGLAFNLIVLALFAYTLWISAGWEFGARLVPQVIGVAGVLLTGALIFSRLFIVPAATPVTTEPGDAFKTGREDVHVDIQADYSGLDTRTAFIRAANYFAWLLFFFAAASIIGLLPGMFLFLVGYMRFEGKESWAMTLGIAVPMWIASYGLFHKILLVPWAPALIGNLFPWLRTNEWFNLV